jgi:hypothetical protein
LAVFPLQGPTYPPGSRGPNRELDFVGRFRIFYRFAEQAKRVEVLAIWDNSPEEPPFSDSSALVTLYDLFILNSLRPQAVEVG